MTLPLALAGLLQGVRGYGQGLLQARDYDRQIREAMRRAALEEQELGLRRAEASRQNEQLQLLRDRERRAQEQSENVRLAFERVRQNMARNRGQLTQPDVVDLLAADPNPSLSGVASILKEMQPYRLETDPQWLRRKAELDYLAGLGAGPFRPRAGATDEELQRDKLFQARVLSIFQGLQRDAAANMEEFDPEQAMTTAISLARRMGPAPGAEHPFAPPGPAQGFNLMGNLGDVIRQGSASPGLSPADVERARTDPDFRRWLIGQGYTVP